MKHLLFSNEVQLENDSRMKLDYCLTEKHSEEDNSKLIYGIQIKKYLNNTIEVDELPGVSESKDTVVAMINKLFKHEVTPISLVEVVDDLITQMDL